MSDRAFFPGIGQAKTRSVTTDRDVVDFFSDALTKNERLCARCTDANTEPRHVAVAVFCPSFFRRFQTLKFRICQLGRVVSQGVV